MKLRVAGRDVDLPDNESSGQALERVLDKKSFKSVVAAELSCQDGQGSQYSRLLDLSVPIPPDCASIEPVYADSEKGLEIIRHSAAHVMALAVKRLFPGAKVAIGPAIDTGFYYDFDVDRPFSSGDFPAIEAEMRRIAAAKLPFVRSEEPKAEAVARFTRQEEPYKVELAKAIPDDTVSLYSCGEFTDLCRGPHVPHTGFAGVAKLMSSAGAYWRGDEKNRMLSRLYGVAFHDRKDLDQWLARLEEAKRRDHRKLGRELQFFTFHEDVAPGMVFWLPRGMMVRTILEDFWRREHVRRGYQLVQGPQLLRMETWQKSGHYQHYAKNMYFSKIEEDNYGIKPMNCIGHMLIYNNELHSYRGLPLRFFELGVVHRHEKSGELHGLLRVRQFTQDDAHILCAPEHLEDEIVGVIGLVNDLMRLFGFEYRIAISTRPEESIGTDEAWELATGALVRAVEKLNIPYALNEGDGAFYGPKIDVRLLDCLGREWQCSTIQVDFTLPERFDLVYVGQDGRRHRPVMVHRAIMGSVERFIGILLEQFAGALPVWLAPEQARILTVTQACDEAAQKIRSRLLGLGIRADTDLRNEKLGFKVREAQLAKVPYIFVVGEREAQLDSVSVRLRDGRNVGLKSVDEAAQMISAEAMEPFIRGGMCYSFA